MSSFSKSLIAWYQVRKRDLPWRNTNEPYFIWLSEIILQQTRVDQGMSYYQKFVVLFPTIHHLANADEDDVLKAWQGLGYYSRARNLHTTAKIISKQHQGKFPQTSIELEKLKGIGSYTSAAIASFCFKEVCPVLDGNVMRFLARLYGISDPVDGSVGKKKLHLLASQLIDKKNPGIFNQAIMEFGATHCTYRQPNCAACLYAISCVAHKTNAIENFPVKGKKTKVKKLFLYYFVIRYKKKVFLLKRTKSGIWQGLHDFPNFESSTELEIGNVIAEFLQEHNMTKSATVVSTSEMFKHILTHRTIHAKFIELELKKTWKSLPTDVFAVLEIEIDKYGIPRLIEKYLESVPQNSSN